MIISGRLLSYTLLLLVFLCSCSTANSKNCTRSELQEWMSNNGKLKVLTTIAMIDDLVKQVGGEYVDSTTLIKGELNPHSYQLVKGDDEKFAYASLIFYNGLGLEHGPSLHHYLYENAKAIALANKIEEKDPMRILYYQGQRDPHIWMDISLWASTVPYIVDALCEKDPRHAAIYRVNGEILIAKMQLAHKQVQEEIATIPIAQRYLVTSHDAFNYFTRAYLATGDEKNTEEWRKRFAAPEGLAPDSQLSTTDIQQIIDHLKRYQIHVLFPESNVSKDSIRKIVQAGKEKGLILHIATASLYGDAMGCPGSEGDTYLKMIQHNAKTITNHLKSASL